MTTNDIEFKNDVILFSIPKTKNYISRMFAVTNEHWIMHIRKYAHLRPSNLKHKRFFVRYHQGKCISQPIGINKIGQAPRVIATFLNLPEPERFSGHCFRRSSASSLANQGGDLITIKRHGGSKSSAVTEGYIDDSLKKKFEVAQILSTSTHPKDSTTAASSNVELDLLPEDSEQSFTITSTNTSNKNIKIHNQTKQMQNIPGITINAAENSNVTISVYNQCTISQR